MNAAAQNILKNNFYLLPLYNAIQIPDAISSNTASTSFANRAEIALILNLFLLANLMKRAPEAARYYWYASNHRKIVFDHGAARTVAWPSGSLPQGKEIFSRFLIPLGYKIAETYPLPELKMTGYAFVHEDLPEDLPQFFISELHPEKFSTKFQEAVSRIVRNSNDSFTDRDLELVEKLRNDGVLSYSNAKTLIHSMSNCFGRHHVYLQMSDYEILLAESAEMAWISTEGNSFNHAADRVQDLETLIVDLKQREFSVKDTIETSNNGRVRQTALKAAKIARGFITPQGRTMRKVPGSFFEFISRDTITDSNGKSYLDLSFDPNNTTEIFKMTS